jgi:hypothetical protein
METHSPSLAGFGQLFRETQELYRRYFGAIAGIMGIVAGVWILLFALATAAGVAALFTGGSEAFSGLLEKQEGLGVFVFMILGGYGLLLLVVSIVMSWWLASLLAFVRSLDDTPLGVLASIREGWNSFRSMWWVYLLTMGTMFGGFVLFVIPGIALSLFFFFAPLAVLFDGKKGVGALYYSYQLVRGSWWKILGRTLVLGLVVAAFVLVVSVILGLISGIATALLPAAGTADKITAMVAPTALMAAMLLLDWFILIPFVIIFVSRLYRALHAMKKTDATKAPSSLFRTMCGICIVVALGGAIGYPVMIYSSLQALFTPGGIAGLSSDTLQAIRAAREADLAGFPDDPGFFSQYQSADGGFSLLMPKKWQSSSFAIIYALARVDGSVELKIEQDLITDKTPRERARDSLAITQSLDKNAQTFNEVDLTIGEKPAYTYSIRFSAFGIPIQHTVYHVRVDEKRSYKITATTVSDDAEFYTPVFQRMIDSLTFTEPVQPE